MVSSFPQVTLVYRWQRSLPSRGTEQLRIYKGPLPIAHLRWRGLVKVQFGGFPSTPITVLVREFKGPGWKGKIEKVAPVSKLGFPPALMSSFSWSLIRNTFFFFFWPSLLAQRWGLWFSSFYNFLHMSGLPGVRKGWTSRTLPSITF